MFARERRTARNRSRLLSLAPPRVPIGGRWLTPVAAPPHRPRGSTIQPLASRISVRPNERAPSSPSHDDQHDQGERPQNERGPSPPAAITRRGLLSAGAAAGLAARLGTIGAVPVALAGSARADDIGPDEARERVRKAKQVREDAALWQAEQPKIGHPDNGDDELYTTDRRGSYSKALPHDSIGVVSASAYTAYLNALKSGKHADFEALTTGAGRPLANPQASYAYSLEGPDSHQVGAPPAPAFASARTAGEMVELYWQALTRDVPFSKYETDPLIAEACADLSSMTDYGGPTLSGSVIPQILFRHSGLIDVLGPYISQFLWVKLPFGSMEGLEQKFKVPVAGDDYVITFAKWLQNQNGGGAAQDNVYKADPRFIYDGRSLARWVHKDFPFQIFVNTAMYLMDLGNNTLSPTNPYKLSTKQAGFVTWGQAGILGLIAHVANLALKACWYEKWLVHRRQRPEKFGGFIHNHMTGAAVYDMHTDVLNSQGLAQTFAKYGTFLLPQAYPEACPTHTAYPSGHASYSGACATVLKALFNEEYILPFPVVANDDGTAVVPYTGPSLNVRGELDKLAFNMCMGRDTAGIHWRSDIEEGMLLGERVAIKFLHDQLKTFNEPFAGFKLTKFDGTPITIV